MTYMTRFGAASRYLLGLLITYSALRGFFLFYNRQTFAALGLGDLSLSFAYGLRFDLSAITLSNALLLMIYLYPGFDIFRIRWVRVLLSGAFVLLNTFLLGAQVADCAYFQFSGRRTDFSGLIVAKEAADQLSTTVVGYPGLWLALVVILALLVKFTMMLRPGLKPYPLRAAWLWYVLVLGLAVLAGRGGWQSKPLIAANGFSGSDVLTLPLTLNTPFTILRSQANAPMAPVNYFTNWADVKAALKANSSRLAPTTKSQVQVPPVNVVIIIVESLAQEYFSSEARPEGFTPFLHQLARKGTLLPLSFANGRRSIEAMTAIFGGLPNLMDQPMVLSPYSGNRIASLPQALKAEGYQTCFFHGGYKGTMFFDAQAKLLGFDDYQGASSYPDRRDDDGYWGIFDEPFLHYVSDQLNAISQPFLAGIFTLSSHYPYTLPAAYQNHFAKGTLPIHESIGYADHALQSFFSYAQTQSWFNHTLFVITGDHTSESDTPTFQSPLGRFRVPLLFYQPGQQLNLYLAPPAQHIDIPATVLDLVGLSPGMFTRFGQSLVVADDRQTLLFDNQAYLLVSRDRLWRLGPDQQINAYAWQRDSQLMQPLAESKSPLEERLKALVQYYRNGMIEDRLSF